MAHVIYPGNYTAPLDVLQPVGVYDPPFVKYRLTGYVDIASTNTLTQFDLLSPSVNNRDADKVYTAGLRVPTGSFILRRALRIPSINTAGNAATLVAANTNRLVLGTANTDTAGNLVVGASTVYAAGPYASDTWSPTVLAANADFRLYVALTGNNGAGTAPTASAGTLRVLWEIVYASPSDVVVIDEIPNASKDTFVKG